jgi:glycosyltransferase involved in cell wall biosynthesis
MKSAIAGTYGIDTSVFSHKDKDYSRKILNLPSEDKLLLYTGRFYPDRNLGMLLTVFSFLQNIFQNLRLIISIKHKDNSYYNMFSEKLKDIIVFEKLPPSKMPYLYSAADLFVSCSTSYFETFGRSPLESIACGTPVVVPDWLGYKDYITDMTGILVPVDYINEPLYDDMSYHIVDPLKFVDRCIKALLSPKKLIDSLPRQTTSSFAVCIIRRIIYEMTREKIRYHRIMDNSLIRYHPIIEEVYRRFNIKSIDELFYFLTCDFKKVNLLEKSLRGHIYNNLFTIALDTK